MLDKGATQSYHITRPRQRRYLAIMPQHLSFVGPGIYSTKQGWKRRCDNSRARFAKKRKDRVEKSP
jgi:hypothetical protein